MMTVVRLDHQANRLRNTKKRGDTKKQTKSFSIGDLLALGSCIAGASRPVAAFESAIPAMPSTPIRQSVPDYTDRGPEDL
eukprot:2397643-Prymnesium_polylepis.1